MVPRLNLAIVAWLALFAVPGCGENSPPPGAPVGEPSPVHGKVTFPDGALSGEEW